MKIQCATLSERGSRAINEDAVFAKGTDRGYTFALADGLGGHGGGELASALAIQGMKTACAQTGLSQVQRLVTGATNAQALILEQQRQRAQRDALKSTLVALDIEEGRAQWLHVGDSRLYWFFQHRLAGRSLDHSVPQMLVRQGMLQEKEIRFHEDRNRLTRVLGLDEETPRYELSETLTLSPPMSFLLCSDGFWELVDEKEMSRQLKRAASPHTWLLSMEQALLKRGAGMKLDNYSAIAVFVR